MEPENMIWPENAGSRVDGILFNVKAGSQNVENEIGKKSKTRFSNEMIQRCCSD